MLEKWTGEVVGLMHINCISNNDMAEELGLTPEYVSMILNGKKKSKSIKERMEKAIEEIVRKRKENK